MKSKRFKQLPKKTKDLPSETIEKLITEVKKIVLQNLMNRLI